MGFKHPTECIRLPSSKYYVILHYGVEAQKQQGSLFKKAVLACYNSLSPKYIAKMSRPNILRITSFNVEKNQNNKKQTQSKMHAGGK